MAPPRPGARPSSSSPRVTPAHASRRFQLAPGQRWIGRRASLARPARANYATSISKLFWPTNPVGSELVGWSGRREPHRGQGRKGADSQRPLRDLKLVGPLANTGNGVCPSPGTALLESDPALMKSRVPANSVIAAPGAGCTPTEPSRALTGNMRLHGK